MGVTGLETAFAVLYTDLVLPGVLPLDLLVERMTAGGGPYGLRAARRCRRARRRTCAWSTSTPAGRSARPDTSRARTTRCFAGRELQGRVLMTLAGGSVAYRERGFAIRLADDPGCSRGRRVKLDRSRAALVVVDVQEAFRPAVLDFEQVAGNVAVLVRGARVLGLPTLVTEQYPKGLGRTVPEVAEHLDGGRADREGVLQRRAGGRVLARRCRTAPRSGPAVRHRDARVREPDRRGPARRTASRCTSRRTRSPRAPRTTARSACTRWSAPARP